MAWWDELTYDRFGWLAVDAIQLPSMDNIATYTGIMKLETLVACFVTDVVVLIHLDIVLPILLEDK